MNISELAREIGVSRVTIYRKCQENGIDLHADRAASGSNDITSDTEQRIKVMFGYGGETACNVMCNTILNTDETENDTESVTAYTDIVTQLAASRATIQGLNEQIELYKRLFEDEREENKQLRKQLEAANAKAIAMIPTADLYKKMFEQEQQRYKDLVELLPPPIERGPRGFIKRLFAGRGRAAAEVTKKDLERGD